MATSQAAHKVEQFIGHDDTSVIKQDIANYKTIAGDSSDTMKALTWQGKNTVKVGMCIP